MSNPLLRASSHPERFGAPLSARRARLAAQWGDLADSGDVVVVSAGLEVPIAGTDQPYAYRPHDMHRYLVGAGAPGNVLGWRAEEGWVLFVPAPDADDAVWHGQAPPPEAWAAATGIDHVRDLDALAAWVGSAERLGVVGALDVLESPGPYGLHPEAVDLWPLSAELSEPLEAAAIQARRAKDPVELAWMREAAEASVAGHLAGIRCARPGLSERDLQIEIESAMARAGGDGPAYASIVLAGHRAAILHGSPSAHQLQERDLVLVDAGAEVAGYDADLTRTYPAGPRWEPAARDIYELVLAAQVEAIEGVKPGVEFAELHLRAARTLTEGLRALGLLRGSIETLVEREVAALFYPHGLGHLLGLATHDVGGYLPGRARDERPTMRFLRTHLPLEAGYVVTIEPGLYFIDALLDDPRLRRQYAELVDWERLEHFRGVGGVRIEDDVLVTESGAEVLSHELPKDPDELLALRAGV